MSSFHGETKLRIRTYTMHRILEASGEGWLHRIARDQQVVRQLPSGLLGETGANHFLPLKEEVHV